MSDNPLSREIMSDLGARRLRWLRRRPDVPVRLRLGWLGYRGAALIIFGIVFVLMGLAVTFNPTPDPALWHTLIPLPIRIFIWSGAGAVSILGALLPRWETLGFCALFIGPFERFLSFAGALISEPNLMRLTGVLVYLLLAMLVVLVAAWPEPSPPPEHPSPGSAGSDRGQA
jgi:hypothetical protein